jgi:drug/metabolite transporter (DMT)-like permease
VPAAETPKRDDLRGALLLALSAIAFSAVFLLVKLASRRLPPPEIAAFRFGIGVAVVGALWAARLVRLRATREQVPLLLLRGFAGGLAVLLLFVAIGRGHVGVATLLNYTSPAFTAVFAWVFLRERLSVWVVAAFAVAAAGVALVWAGTAGAESGPAPLLGWQTLGLASAALAGVAITAIRALRRYRAASSWTVFAVFSAAGLVCTAPLAAPGFLAPTPREWTLLALMGLAAVAGQLLMTQALADVTAALSGIIQQLTVVLALLLGVLVLGESIGPASIAGAALTMAGVAWAAWLSRERA